MFICWCSDLLSLYMYGKQTLPVSDIGPISMEIPYYINIRELCGYYNTLYYISFVMYQVESVLLSCYIVWWNNLLIHIMLLGGFILLETFITPAIISINIKQQVEDFPILWVIRFHSCREIVESIAIIIPTCHSQFGKSAWNQLFSTIG